MSGRGRIGALLLFVVIVVFVGVMSTIVTSMAIWPGEAKLTAPLLCSDERPDPYIVRDTYNVRPGETSMTFTMYCVGPRGDYDEIGVFKPFLVLAAAHTAIVAVLGIFVLLRVGSRVARRRDDRLPPSQEPSNPSIIT